MQNRTNGGHRELRVIEKKERNSNFWSLLVLLDGSWSYVSFDFTIRFYFWFVVRANQMFGFWCQSIEFYKCGDMPNVSIRFAVT